MCNFLIVLCYCKKSFDVGAPKAEMSKFPNENIDYRSQWRPSTKLVGVAYWPSFLDYVLEGKGLWSFQVLGFNQENYRSILRLQLHLVILGAVHKLCRLKMAIFGPLPSFFIK